LLQRASSSLEITLSQVREQNFIGDEQQYDTNLDGIEAGFKYKIYRSNINMCQFLRVEKAFA